MSLNNFLIGDSSNRVKPHPHATSQNQQHFYVKILRGTVATYFAGDEENHAETATQAKATDLKTLSEARVKSRVLLYGQAQNIDSTEVEIVL